MNGLTFFVVARVITKYQIILIFFKFFFYIYIYIQDVQNICKTEIVSYHDSMDDPWYPTPSDRPWTKDSVGDVFEVLSISEPGRDVSWSRWTFQITDEHVKSCFTLNMNCFKVHQLFEHEGYSLKMHSWSFGWYQAIIT